jgi:ABC-type transport system involved in multi-copper enzyme maturation permease subunit
MTTPASRRALVTASLAQTRVLHSEWTKLHSLRSSRITLLVAVGLVVGLGLLIPLMSVADWDPNTNAADYDAVSRSLGGIYLAQLAFGVLGVLLITGEYTTGMIRATFAAVPKRLPVLWGKLAVFAATTVVLGTLACLTAFLAGQAIFATKDVDAGLGDPGVLRAVLGAGLFLAGVGLLGVGLGALIRNSAGAIATLTGLLFVVPVIVSALPQRWADAVGPYLPGQAGTTILFTEASGPYGPWTGLGILGAWAAVAVALAAVMLIRRDV